MAYASNYAEHDEYDPGERSGGEQLSARGVQKYKARPTRKRPVHHAWEWGTQDNLEGSTNNEFASTDQMYGNDHPSEKNWDGLMG
jgi:hypothetical protein